MPEALQAQRGRRASGVVAAMVSPCATSRAVAVSSPDAAFARSADPARSRNTSQARHLGHAVSMAMLGSVQLPDWKVWVLGVVPLVNAAAERRLQPEPEGFDIDRDTNRHRR
jgi:hypothetical protein